MIDILIPVLGRPANAQKVADSIHAATVVPHIITFLCTRGDHEEIEACKATGSIVHLSDEGYGRKINEGIAADYGRSEFFFMGADDLLFHPGWDRHAIRAFERDGKPVVGTQDLHNPMVLAGRHSTHTLVHRSYVERGTADEPGSGKLLCELYSHNWVDNEFVETAKSRDSFIFCPDSLVEHQHPIWGTAVDDATYAKGREDYHADRRLFQTRRRLWHGR